MTAQEVDAIATAVAEKVAKLLRADTLKPTLHPCAWNMLMPYEKRCNTSGQVHARVASLADGTPMDSDWKTMWFCDAHYELLTQHNGYEVEEA